MNSVLSSTARKGIIVLGLFVFALVAFAARPSGQAQGQEVGPTLTITKLCVGADTGTFTLALNTVGTLAEQVEGIPAGPVEFLEPIGTIDCGDTTTFPFFPILGTPLAPFAFFLQACDIQTGGTIC